MVITQSAGAWFQFPVSELKAVARKVLSPILGLRWAF